MKQDRKKRGGWREGTAEHESDVRQKKDRSGEQKSK